MKHSLDAQDKRLLHAITENGQASVGLLATRLGLSAPTIRTRMRNLMNAGILKMAGLVNACDNDGLIVAFIGLNISSYGGLAKVVDKLVKLEGVTWAAVVTGRFDVLVEVVVEGGVADLYRLTTQTIPSVGVVDRTETLVVMSARNKWVSLPKGFEHWSGTAGRKKGPAKNAARQPRRRGGER